jgi:hypothetical protein
MQQLNVVVWDMHCCCSHVYESSAPAATRRAVTMLLGAVMASMAMIAARPSMQAQAMSEE